MSSKGKESKKEDAKAAAAAAASAGHYSKETKETKAVAAAATAAAGGGGKDSKDSKEAKDAKKEAKKEAAKEKREKKNKEKKEAGRVRKEVLPYGEVLKQRRKKLTTPTLKRMMRNAMADVNRELTKLNLKPCTARFSSDVVPFVHASAMSFVRKFVELSCAHAQFSGRKTIWQSDAGYTTGLIAQGSPYHICYQRNRELSQPVFRDAEEKLAPVIEECNADVIAQFEELKNTQKADKARNESARNAAARAAADERALSLAR
jgi:histone H3/H4